MAMTYVGVPAYLVVVVYSIRDLVQSHSGVVAAAAIAAVVAFSVVFFSLALPRRQVSSERFVLRSIGAMALIAVLLAVLGSATAAYLTTVAAMAGDSLRPRVALPFILGASAAVAVTSTVHGFGVEDVVVQPVIVIVVGLFTLGLRRVTEANRELIQAREEVARLAVANERLRFARDLHDLLGHTLTVIRAKSELASRIAGTNLDQAVREMNEVEAVARLALVEVRETVTGYRRPTLLSEVANARTVLAGAHIDATVTTDHLDLPTEVDEALGWVLREAVTNVVRHSGARGCRIEVTHADAVVVLQVSDDGHGEAQGPGNGLTGARERLSIVGGTLESGNGSSSGFRVVARVPSTP
jgi:two-component system sensor histidine kinase DesK